MEGPSEDLQANLEKMIDFALSRPTDMRSRRATGTQSQRYNYIYLNVTVDKEELVKHEFCNNLPLLRPDCHPECLWLGNR